MSTLPMPGGKNPLMLGALVLAGFWLYSRSAGARAAPMRSSRALTPAGRPLTVPYSTPTAVAGQLAGAVVSMVKGILPGPTKGIAAGDVTSRDALRAAERASDPGYYGWQGASDGTIDDQNYGHEGANYPYVDGLPVAPVYDTASFSNNGVGSYWGIE